MIDKKLEKQIHYIERFIALWNQLYQQTEAGLQLTEVTPEQEANYRNLKSRIAFATQTLKNLIGDDFRLRKDIIKVLRFAVSISILKNESPIRINNLRSNWHQVFIQLNTLQGTFKSRRDQLANVNQTTYQIQTITKSKGFRLAIIAVVAIVAIAIAATLVIANLDTIKGLLPG